MFSRPGGRHKSAGVSGLTRHEVRIPLSYVMSPRPSTATLVAGEPGLSKGDFFEFLVDNSIVTLAYYSRKVVRPGPAGAFLF
jgi:hypothetical protein